MIYDLQFFFVKNIFHWSDGHCSNNIGLVWENGQFDESKNTLKIQLFIYLFIYLCLNKFDWSTEQFD